MNEESVMHQSKILQFNEHAKQFQEEEVQRMLHEAEWKQKENDARLKVLHYLHSTAVASQRSC